MSMSFFFFSVTFSPATILEGILTAASPPSGPGFSFALPLPSGTSSTCFSLPHQLPCSTTEVFGSSFLWAMLTIPLSVYRLTPESVIGGMGAFRE